MSCPTIFMSCPRSTPEAAPRQSTFVARAAELVRNGWRAYWDWRARKVTVMILHSLDRRTLHDIGIEPSEIESLVHGGGDRCRRYDATWLWR